MADPIRAKRSIQKTRLVVRLDTGQGQGAAMTKAEHFPTKIIYARSKIRPKADIFECREAAVNLLARTLGPLGPLNLHHVNKYWILLHQITDFLHRGGEVKLQLHNGEPMLTACIPDPPLKRRKPL